jgi:hypothetical protein
MKKLLAFVFILFIFSVSAQSKLKKKYFGKYEGEIGSYTIDSGTDLLQIQKSSIEIEFKANGTLTQKIGKLTKEGSWKLFFEADDYFVFDVTFSDQAMSDRILLYKKGKKISREGITPQPSSILFLKK